MYFNFDLGPCRCLPEWLGGKIGTGLFQGTLRYRPAPAKPLAIPAGAWTAMLWHGSFSIPCPEESSFIYEDCLRVIRGLDCLVILINWIKFDS